MYDGKKCTSVKRGRRARPNRLSRQCGILNI
jgi:hypothetical protein